MPPVSFYRLSFFILFEQVSRIFPAFEYVCAVFFALHEPVDSGEDAVSRRERKARFMLPPEPDDGDAPAPSAVGERRHAYRVFGVGVRKFRYRMSGISDSIGGKKKVDKVHSDFAADEKAYVEAMRRRYPTMVRKLIDERNVHMAEQINRASERFSNMIVVVGDAHVEGICELLEDKDVRKIRLIDLMDRERMDKVRNMVWKGESQ